MGFHADVELLIVKILNRAYVVQVFQQKMSEFLPWNTGTIKRFLSKIGSAVHCLGILSVLHKLPITLSVL